ncbi:alcohol dehydrogenase [Trinickia terrae]|uniref:Alcohol dehydrogenase n=1 Tax=Trinickia terrae TaxID=2571161 RepID=A0A4U1I5T1_9BURK|nr:alcohol dehydrogenase [Trinickia terrae]TKC88711.1 alcohol dehydrogenase [Trinickia terrae]
MQRIVHTGHGEPAKVLRLEALSDASPLAGGMARVRVSATPVHPGDLLGVSASPAFGAPPVIPRGGRVPGVEGVGVVEALAAGIDPSHPVQVGSRVAFLSANGAWSSRIAAPVQSLIPVPDEVGDEVAAQMSINTLTARLAMRAGHNALPEDKRTDVTVIQTAANSAVGKLLTHLLIEVGVNPILLAGSAASAQALKAARPNLPVIATENPGWKGELRDAVAKKSVYVAFDGVGGSLLPDVAGFLARGGAIISYGSLGGAQTDIRSIAPQALTIKGVSLFSWQFEPAAVRNADLAKALELAHNFPSLFPVAERYPAADYLAALEHAGRRGKTGTVLLAF